MKNRTFKNLIILLFSLSFTVNSTAQLKKSAAVRLDKFQEIYAAGPNIFTFNAGEKYGLQNLQIFDAAGKNLNSMTIASKIGYTFQGVIALENVNIIFLAAKKSNILLAIDHNGKEVKRTEWEDISFKDAKLLNIDGSNFYLIGNMKNGSPGYVIRKYNTDFEMAWDYKMFPEKNKYFFELATTNSNGDLAILYRIKAANYSLSIFNNKGVILADNALAIKEYTKYDPYFLKINDDNSLFLASDYGLADSKDIFSMKSAVNLKTFDLTGAEQKNQELAFIDIVEKEELPTNVPIGFRILDVINSDNKTKLVFEQYSVMKRVVSVASKTSSTPTNVTHFDVILSDTYLMNASDINSNYFRIWKPTRTMSIKGLSSFESASGICSKLEKYNLFGYQYYEDNKIVVRGFSQNLEYINEFASSNAYDVSTTRKHWGKPISANAVYSNDQGLMANYSFASGFGGRKDLNRNGVFKLDKNIVVYQYNSATGNLEFYTYK